jgi:hypothetical protein
MPVRDRKRYDYRDSTVAEATLRRAGQTIWAILRREKRAGGLYVSEERALYEAIETVCRAKQELRSEIEARRQDRSARLRGRFRPAKELPLFDDLRM